MSFLKALTNSIARTFGRIIAYALIGIAIYFIGQHFVNAQGQYRMSDLTNSWTNWENISIGTDYGNSTNITTNWGSYIQLKDTTAMESNKTYNFNTSFKITIIGQGDRELFSSIVPYIYNGTTLTDVSDKCSMSGTKSDSTSSGLLPQTTHIYNANINCVGLKGNGYYPYITIRFKANANTLLTTERINVSSWNYSVGTDSTDANNIMNNANQNTQNIINGINDMGDNITNSVEQSTEEITNAIQNQYNVCSNYDINKNNIIYDREGAYLNSSGNQSTNSTFNISGFYKITANKTYTFQKSWTTNSRYYCIYDNDKTLISCTNMNTYTYAQTFTPSQDGYVRFSIMNNTTSTFTFTGSYCYNALEKESETNDEINANIKNFLTIFNDDSTPSDSVIQGALNGIDMPDETPFTNLLMFPIVIFSFFSNSMSATCSSVNLGTLYGHTLSLPCLNVANYLGLSLWNIIDLLAMFYMIYNIVHLLIGIFEDISELRSPFLRFFIKNRGVINSD